MLRTPGTQEVFTLNRDPALAPQAGQMGGVAHFGFRLRERQDLAQVLEQAVAAGGVGLKQGSRKQGAEQYAILKDPDGYEIEVFWESTE
jgi:catechol-2,3-dioxygenase